IVDRNVKIQPRCRFSAGYPRNAGSENPQPWAEPRLGNRATHPTGVKRRAQGWRGIALSCATTLAAQQFRIRWVGGYRKQPASPVLPRHAGWKKAARGGKAQL